MATITDIPRARTCSGCGAKLRIATRAEIEADLKDPRYRQAAEGAAQGSHEWEPPDHWPDWRKYEPGSPRWLLRCDDCGARVLWSQMLDE